MDNFHASEASFSILGEVAGVYETESNFKILKLRYFVKNKAGSLLTKFCSVSIFSAALIATCSDLNRNDKIYVKGKVEEQSSSGSYQSNILVANYIVKI